MTTTTFNNTLKGMAAAVLLLGAAGHAVAYEALPIPLRHQLTTPQRRKKWSWANSFTSIRACRWTALYPVIPAIT